MLNSISHLDGSTLSATDGEIGHVKEAYFDDVVWAVRYLVVDTGTWLSGREVLISPYSVVQPVGNGKSIAVRLTRQQVENSPVTDTHQPVSRRHERETLSYYAYPEYWGGADLWAMGPLPLLPPLLPVTVESQAEAARREEAVPAEDVHLRSSANITGYDIQATDDSIGHVKDFIFDDESWAVRYLVVDTRNWWPGGKKVLLATRWIDRIDWADKTVHTTLTREQVKNSPEYDEAAVVDRVYEQRLHDAYGREGYWD
ncbi:MAG: PRC-barrel domain-containing protein [Rhizobacter sp.]|nr:PRC-barrel domain-containing protein [Rhizobacter sp.]